MTNPAAEKVDAWMPLWIGSYLADTMALTRDQHGGYLLLLFAYWRNKGPLPDDDEELAGITRATAAEWKKLGPRLARFFTVADGTWAHTRADKELVTAGLRKAGATAKAKAAAEARWGKPAADAPSIAPSTAPSTSPSNPQALPEDCPTPSPLPIGNSSGAAGIQKPPRQQPISRGGEVCRALKTKGMVDVNPSHPELLALIAKGVPIESFEAAAEKCLKATPRKGMAYLLGIVKRELADAATIATGAGMPTAAWDATRASIEAKAIALGLGKWNDADMSASREQFPAYLLRVRAAVEEVPA